MEWTSSQDKGIGRYALLPHRTKRRTTTNLKTKNNQNCQEIEVYGSPTTITKIYSFRLVRGVETGSQGKEDVRQGVAWRTGWARWQLVGQAVPHLCADNREEQLGSEINHATRVTAWGNKASEPLAVKICGGCGGGRDSQPYRRVCWRNPQGPRMYTNPPTQESAPGPNLLVGSGGSD